MEEKKHNLVYIAKGVLIAYVVTVLLLAIFAILLAYTGVPESTMPVGVLVISIVSILLASSITVRKLKEKGLLHGALIGLCYILILYLLSSIFLVGFQLDTYSITMIAFSMLAGMIGGIIGVNG